MRVRELIIIHVRLSLCRMISDDGPDEEWWTANRNSPQRGSTETELHVCKHDKLGGCGLQLTIIMSKLKM